LFDVTVFALRAATIRRKPLEPLANWAEPQPSLLVLEDNVLQATNLADLLEAAGYRVLGPIRSVHEAMRVLEVDRIDGALLDIKLGDDNSTRIAETLTKRWIPVLFVSGYPKPDAPTYENLAYLQKPYTEEQLLDSVAALLSANARHT
jgi:two-component SAPR family response regulator